MASIMLALGMFPFSLGNLPFQELQRKTSWRHGQVPRYGARPANQSMGPENDQVTISGLCVPGVVGRLEAIQQLRDMGDTGAGWPLVTGYGDVLGTFVIDSVDEGRTLFLDDGHPRKADFTVQLHRVDDDDARDRTLPVGLKSKIRG